jgi:ribosomal protein S18 acetylase RimI-like enzyme
MPNEDPYSFEPLVAGSGPAFDVFYRIYVESIALREQKPESQIRALVTKPDYTVLLLKKDAAVIGFSMLFTPPDQEFCLLEYMAIAAACRNRGLGSELFVRSMQAGLAGSLRYGLLEIDSESEPSADHDIRMKRERFYRKLGCRRIEGLAYILPLQGKGPVPQMHLMIYSSSNATSISRMQLEGWLEVIYQQVYDCPPDDPRISTMMKAVGDPIKLV